MPDFTDLDDSFNNRARDSFNTTTNNTANLGFDLEDVGNEDNSVDGSGNVDVALDGSFNEDSHDTETETDTDIEDSFNDESDNSSEDNSDNSVTDSYNDNSDNSTNHSNNTLTDESTDDHSVNAGLRSYTTGFGDVSLGAAAAGGGGGGGDVTIDGRTTIVDQSFNANVAGFGGGGGAEEASAFGGDGGGWDGHDGGGGGFTYETEAVVASGDGAIAAGNDVSISQSLDESTNITGGGDVNMGNTTEVTTVVGSFNQETDNSSYVDNSMDVDVEESFNDNSDNYSATDSFNEELNTMSEDNWTVDADVIWDSDESAIVEDTDVDLDLDL